MSFREFRDIYRGFGIDYNPSHEGYHIYLHCDKIHQCDSYDECYEWIDSYIKQNSLGLGLRLFQV